MNFRYFACPVCKKFTSAGYRWAYWHLEYPGLVEPNKAVDARRLLAAGEYWHPPLENESAWLYDGVFPLIKAFLSEHADHGIIFVESGDFFDRDDFDAWVEMEKR